MKAVSKTGTEAVSSNAASLLEISAKNIDGANVELGSILTGKKCTLVVNVATIEALPIRTTKKWCKSMSS